MFRGPLYRMPEDNSCGRTEAAWKKLGCALKPEAVGFKVMGSVVYNPHEVFLQKVLKT